MSSGGGEDPMADDESRLYFPWPWPIVSTAWTPIANGTPTDCDWQNGLQYKLEVTSLTTAATIILLLNLTQPRTRHQCQPYTLWSLLDVVSPVKFIGGSPLRYMYCIIMSCWAGDVVQDACNRSLYYHSDNDLLDAFKVFVLSPTVIILKEALLYFPVLACVDAPVRVLGYSIGFLYTLLLGVYKVDIEAVLIMGCSYFGQQTSKEIGVSLAVHVPVYVGLLVVAVWFFCHALMELTLLIFSQSSIHRHAPVYNEYTGYLNRVKHLLQRSVKPTRSRLHNNAHTLWRNLVRGFRYVLPYKSNFIYPLPFLSSVCMSWMILYQLTVYVLYKEIEYGNHLKEFIAGFSITVETIENIFPSVKHRVDDFFYDANSFAEAYYFILPVSSSVGFLLCAVLTLYMAQTFHKQLRQAYRGDISHLVQSEPLPSPAYRLAATMRYSAFLVSHLIFSLFLYSLIGLVLLSIGLVFYYLFKDARFYGIHVWSFFMVPMMWSAGMHQLQLVLCRYVFHDKSGGNGLIKIRYKTLFNVLTYVFLFFNVIFGVVICFLRVFGVFIFSNVMLFRLDWDVYMRGLEGWDMSNRTYVGYVYTEITINNAVVRVFVKIMQDTINGKKSSLPHERGAHLRLRSHCKSPSEFSTDDGERTPLVSGSALVNAGSGEYSSTSLSKPSLRGSSVAHNRWLVAYTLLRNPSLQHLTASRLSRHREQCIGSIQLQSNSYSCIDNITS